MDQKQQQQQQGTTSPVMFPVWAIVIVVFAVILIMVAALYYFRRRMTKSVSVHTIHHEKQDKFVANKGIKKSFSLGSFQTLATQKQQKSSERSKNNSCITTTPLPPIPIVTINSPSSAVHNKENKNEDKRALILDESECNYLPPEPPQEIKISLPLPPPSTLFFSDKMELEDGGSQDLYDMYLRSKNNDSNDGFISIDLDPSITDSGAVAAGTTSFYSNAALNIQQKAVTIKTSLYQSLRSKQTSINGGRSSAQQLFSSTNNNNEKKLGESYGYQSTTAHTIDKNQYLLNNSTITTDSNKKVIDLRESAAINNEINNNIATKQKLNHPLTVTYSSNNDDTVDDDADESPITPNPNLQETVRAAKRVIRSASRKTKTHSMVVNNNEEFVAPLKNSSDVVGGNDLALGCGATNRRESRKSSHGSIRFASIRGPKNGGGGGGEHLTITSGSMRHLARESILFDDDSLPSIPIVSFVATASTKNSTSSKKSGVSAVDIASWWENNSNSVATPKNLNLAATSTSDKEDGNKSLPLYSNVSTGTNNSSSTPNQYRASLSTSIFGTLSRSSGSAVTGEDNKEEYFTGTVTRNNSYMRGTLNRSTLRNITANATNGVNRSIKGLFEHHSSIASASINKIATAVANDSQKMELDSEPIQMAIEEKIPLDSHNQEQQQIKYNLIRQRSMRNNSNNTDGGIKLNVIPSVTSLTTSESSTKYALSDDEYILDESSEKVAIDDTQEPPIIDDKMKAKLKEEQEAFYQQQSPKAASTFSTKNRELSSSSGTTNYNGEVDVIRRMLQETWINNMRESGSLLSITSEIDNVATTPSNHQLTIIPTVPATNKINPPRQQSQYLLTKSLLNQQVAKRASLITRNGTSMEGLVPQRGPEPSASFSSSTVRTMVPEASSSSTLDIIGSSEPITIRQNAIIAQQQATTTTSHHLDKSNINNNGSNKVQASCSYEENMPLNRFSTSPMDSTATTSSPRNSSADSSRGHSRKSSGGNSAATALRISSGYTTNAKTWNGRPHQNRPSVTRLINDEDATTTPPSNLISSPPSAEPYYSIGRSTKNSRTFFSTMRKGQKTRGGIPWMMYDDENCQETEGEEEERTPAQIERDRYLQGRRNQ